MDRCPICLGAQKIRLPLHRPVTVSFEPAESISIGETSRQYPCPECAPTVSADNVAILKFHSLVDSRISDPEFTRHARRSMVHLIADQIERQQFILFHKGPPDAYHLRYQMQATIGVVAPATVATMEQRIAEHQEELARDVIEIACASINHWGSHYHHTNLDKDQATSSVRQALDTALKRRAAMKAMP